MLLELSDLAWALFAEAQGSRRTVAFIAAELLSSAGRQLDAGPIAAKVANECISLINPPLIAALDWLAELTPDSDPMGVANALTEAFARCDEMFRS